jgi:hypothetical protein
MLKNEQPDDRLRYSHPTEPRFRPVKPAGDGFPIEKFQDTPQE